LYVGCSRLPVKVGPFWGCFVRGSVRFWLAGGAGPDIEVVHPISVFLKADAVVQCRLSKNVRLYMKVQVALEP
jgi:hypothetical protein